MIRNFIICLSIIFFALSGIISFKASGIPARNTGYQNNLKELKLKNLSKELFLYSRQDNSNILTEELKVDSQYASRIIYTIQTGSHIKKADAEEEFNSILQALNKKEHDYLRIEKIGKFYTVRLGKFDNYANAEKFHKAIQPQLSTAVILKAYIKNERIIKLYPGSHYSS